MPTKKSPSSKKPPSVTLTTAYFPPVEYFSILAKCPTVFLDSTENYQKQSYRNRCVILTADGPMDLRFPVIHGGSRRIDGILVDYSTNWVPKTEYAIDTAYYSSPFFEYYRDELFDILNSRPERLWDLDKEVMMFFIRKIGLSTVLMDSGVVSEWNSVPVIHPKVKSSYEAKPYWQVFRDKHGFVPNLSIMDLLFNEGPESICYL